jgi:hypothetical protein
MLSCGTTSIADYGRRGLRSLFALNGYRAHCEAATFSPVAYEPDKIQRIREETADKGVRPTSQVVLNINYLIVCTRRFETAEWLL